MILLATLKIALLALRRNKLRTLLTMLGMIIGVGAVIAVVSIGSGAKAQIEAQIASMGQNVIRIMSGNMSRGGFRFGFGTAGTLTREDMDVRTSRKVALIGRTAAEMLFPDEDPVGKAIRIKNSPFVVVGLLAPKGV